jgi:hypothetical protein
MIKHSMNVNNFEKNYETNTQPSLTIPDQTMTIRTILERHSRGLPIDGIKVPIWDGEDNDLPDWRRLDLAERQELSHLYKQEINDIKSRQYTKIDKKDEVKDNERVNVIESISGEPKADL